MIRCSTEEEFLMLKQWLKIIFIGRLPEELQNGFEELVERINTEEVDKMVSNLGLTIDELKRKERIAGKAEGKVEGKAEGREEGEIKKAMEIAKKMKKKNISIKLIVEFTGISEDEISKI
jgi:predicted transposase YdaD